MKTILTALAFSLLSYSSFAKKVDSLDIKIGQMIMIGISDRTSLPAEDPIIEELEEGKIGGIVLFEKNVAASNSHNTLKQLTSDLQSHVTIPLFVTIDEEGGRVHRLKEKYGFVAMPSAAHLGKLNNPDSTLYYNRRLAALLKDLGITLNYSPSVDVAVNPDNPVIVKAGRSFSSDPAIVARHAKLVIQAHHENGVKTILKHFPGHGSSSTDSHLGVVDVTNTWNFIELLPYNELLRTGDIDAIMTAHIVNRHWDASELPATLSKEVVTDMLRGILGYQGVVFSDDMQMHAISKNYGFEKAIGLAINAGVDVVMFANSVSKEDKVLSASEAHAIIRKLVRRGTIKRARIDEAYNRIIALKNKQVS